MPFVQNDTLLRSLSTTDAINVMISRLPFHIEQSAIGLLFLFGFSVRVDLSRDATAETIVLCHHLICRNNHVKF